MAESLKGIDVDGVSYALEAYPVGSIYMSVNATDPATIFGGSWERIQSRFLLGADSTYAAGSTGGEATHTLTVNEMPKHAHTLFKYEKAGNDSYLSTGTSIQNSGTTYCKEVSNNMGNTGGNAAHNNMPPYLAVYIWKRTA